MTTMIGILVPSLFFCCGICIYAGFLHIANGLRRPIDIPKLLFALICFTSIPFVISLSRMLKAEELGAFIFALKWNLAAGLWFYLELIWFIAQFTKKYSPPLLIALSIIFCVLLLVNYAQPYGLQYSEISSLKTLELPWGEFVSLTIGQVSEWYYFSMIMFFICFCYIFYALITNYRQTRKKHLLGMIFAIAFFMVCVIEGTLARLSIINFIYLGPYGFMGLIIVMSMILDHDYHQNLREKDEKLHYLYKLSPLGIALTDMQGRYLEFNEAFSNISGYPADIIAPACGCIDNWRSPSPAPVLHPILILLGNLAQLVACHPFAFAIGIEKADDSLGLLKGLNQAVQKDSVKTPIAKFDAIFMMLVEVVHRSISCVVEYQELTSFERFYGFTTNPLSLKGYQGRSPWLVGAAASGAFSAH